MLTLLKEQKSRFAPAYLAHKYMGQHWDPLFVTEVRSEMAEIGLKPVGSATLVENHDSFVLGRAAREALAVIGDEDVMARDFLIDQFFRRDVFVREGANLDETAQRRRLLDGTFLLARELSPSGPTVRRLATGHGLKRRIGQGYPTAGSHRRRMDRARTGSAGHPTFLVMATAVSTSSTAKITLATITTALIAHQICCSFFCMPSGLLCVGCANFRDNNRFANEDASNFGIGTS